MHSHAFHNFLSTQNAIYKYMFDKYLFLRTKTSCHSNIRAFYFIKMRDFWNSFIYRTKLESFEFINPINCNLHLS